MPILIEGVTVDRLLLARIDPVRWRFSVHSGEAGNRSIDRWMRELGAALVVNGSYFGPRGEPDTPFLSEGVPMGPRAYKSSHGAFVASADGANVVDLKTRDWKQAFEGKTDAMISYPLLLDENGLSRAKSSKWLAGRTFVGQDKSGRIVIGTTTDASLSLDRLAGLLKEAPLDLATALNLDGGPVACQKIQLGDYSRRPCGPPELEVEGSKISLLQTVTEGDFGLPVVLAVSSK